MWNLITGEATLIPAFTERPDFHVDRLGFSPGGHWLIAYSSSRGGTIRLWNTDRIEEQLTIMTGGYVLPVNDWQFNADETLLAIGGGKMTGDQNNRHRSPV